MCLRLLQSPMATLLLFGVLFVPQYHALPCTTAQVRQCLKPLQGYEYELDNAIVPTMDEASLSEHCRRYDLFENCMKDVKPQCTTLDKLIFMGIEDAYQFLCYDGKAEYLEHRQCFKNKDLHKEGDSCNKTYTDRLNTLDTSKSTSFKKDRICQYTKQYLDCVERVVESFCEVRAAKWQRTLDTKSLNPLLTRIGCSLESYAQQHWVSITIGVLLTVAVIIIIVSIVLMVMHKKKRAPRDSTVQSDAPPAYSGPYMMYNPSVGVSNEGYTPEQAGPVPQKSEPMDPPPYQPAPTQPTSPEYTELQNVTSDSAVAAGYFGLDPNLNTQAIPAAENKTPIA